MRLKIFSIIGVLALLVSLSPKCLIAGPGDLIGSAKNYQYDLGISQRQLKMKALEAQLKGKALGKTFQIAPGQFVEL